MAEAVGSAKGQVETSNCIDSHIGTSIDVISHIKACEGLHTHILHLAIDRGVGAKTDIGRKADAK